MESLGASLEAEQRAKAEALRIKKKLEGDINELEIGLDHANKANAEGLKAIKRYQTQLRETIQAYEDEARQRQQVSEQVGIAERKAAALSGEVEESRALLDSADRSKRQLDMEIADARNSCNALQAINSREMASKRALEGSLHTVQAEILEGRLSDAEAAAMKGGKAAMAKLEMRIRELENELGSLQSRTSENMKAFQRAERKVKELQFGQDEDKKNQEKMSDLAAKLQQKIKTYKQQIEEAEEIAALNLAKFRKAQQELEETEERAKLADAGLQVARFV